MKNGEDKRSADDVDLSDIPPLDFDLLLEKQCRGKRELALRLLTQLLDESGPKWLSEAERLIPLEDFPAIVKLGHGIRGTAAILKAARLAAAGLQLEEAGAARDRELADLAQRRLKRVWSELLNWVAETGLVR